MSTNNIPNTTDWTFEKVMLAIEKKAEQSAKELKEFKESLQQTHKQTEETLKQFIKQTNEQFKQTNEQFKQTDERVKRTSKQLGKLGNRFGSMEEYLVAPGMIRQFNAINYHFSSTVRNYKIYGENKKKLAEIDVMLENDDYILCVEVKTAPEGKDIRKHIERLKIAQCHFKNLRPKEKKIIGAIAGTIFSDRFKEEVIASGLYAITPSGHTFKIDVPEGFQPKIFYGE